MEAYFRHTNFYVSIYPMPIYESLIWLIFRTGNFVFQGMGMIAGREGEIPASKNGRRMIKTVE